MDKLKMHSPNKVDENIEKIGKLFPNCLTERIVGYKDEVRPDGSREPIMERAIDFDMLRQELSSVIVEGNEERYQFTWPDKKKSILLANAPIAATLRPCREESVDFDNTENLYIEGDNLDVLKLLQETYLGKIKLIYIDPPYNTGNDFIYEDDFAENVDEYLTISGQFDVDGNRLVQNTENNGRFHSDWLNMIYPRLKLAKDLLSDDGVILISIGEDELDNLHKIGNEIFGELNEITIFPRVMKSGGAKGQFYTPNIDYIIVYAKDKLLAESFRAEFSDEQIDRFYNRIETEGLRKGEKYGIERIYKASLDARPNQRYYIECPDGELVIPPGVHFPSEKLEGIRVLPNSEDHVWKWTYERYKKEKELNNIVFIRSDQTGLVNSDNQKAKWNVYNKLWLSEQQEKGIVPGNFIPNYENRQSSAELNKLGIPFDYAKPTKLLKYLFNMCSREKNYYILDFFSGSASTADTVMQMNATDSGKRKYIMIQIPEACDEYSAEFKTGYINICEIGKERIRRAGTRIKEENPLTTADLDTGFRVLKLDSSNMKDVYYNPSEYEQSALDGLADNIKEDRTPEDLLFQVMLDLGVLLSSKIVESEIAGKKVFSVADGFLIACFDADISDEVITEIAKKKPYYFVLRDGSLSSDSVATNFDQIFATYSPDTVRKVL